MKDDLKLAIGPKTQALARKTRPGLMAGALDDLLYSADYTEPESKHHSRKVKCKAVVRVASDQPWNARSWVNEKGEADTLALLREIRDYLEAIAFREVIE